MSLIKQLWMGIAVLMLIAFGGSFAVSTWSAVNYLEQQLQLKDIDNATSLALSMSQMDKDPVTIELLIAAQFDAGHYEQIVLRDPTGATMVEKTYTGGSDWAAPDWFHNLVALDTQPATALVQDGWSQYGVITVQSHSGFAIDSLWTGTLRLLQWFVVLGLLGGALGTVFLKTISRPLDVVLGQAEAIGDRRFVTSAEPRTLEFRRLVKAMNHLSGQVKLMLEKEARQLDTLRRRLQHDDLTGLPNREHFFNLLSGAIENDTTNHGAAMMMIRVDNLQNVNTQLGRAATDDLLRSLAELLNQITEHHGHCFSGRLNGSDFTLLVPSRYDPEPLVEQLRQDLDILLLRIEQDCPEAGLGLPLACCEFDDSATRGKLMMHIDGALSEAEQQGPRGMVISTLQQRDAPHANLDEWREVLEHALREIPPELASYPVRTLDGGLLHTEMPVCWYLDGEVRPARYFVPWIARLGLLPEMDLKVAEVALNLAASGADNEDQLLAINLAAESILDTGFRQELLTLLQAQPEAARRLAFECHEFCAIRHAQTFRQLCAELQLAGCQVGLEHAGPEFARLENLQDLGLKYIKIDSALIRNIHQDTGNQTFVRGLCSIGHSLGITMIAQGVINEEEKAALDELGVDAATGPGVA